MAPSRKKPSASRPSLTPEAIVDAATVLIERDGLAAFTMRSLGRELGMSAMAVYGYFSSRDELLCAVLERFMDTLDTNPIPGERWDDTLRRTMTSIYREELAHPELAVIEVEPRTARALERHTERTVSHHLAQGWPEPVLHQAWALIDAYLTGFIGNALALRRLGKAAGAAPSPRDGEAGASEERQPWQRIVEDAYTDEAFAHGVEIVIQGIRGLAAPDPCEWRTPEA